jgi:hypothetical protein
VEQPEEEAKLPRIAPGVVITLTGEGFGQQQGTVELAIGGVSLPMRVVGWTNTEIKAAVPEIGVTSAIASRLTVKSAAGETLQDADVQLVPAPAATE